MANLLQIAGLKAFYRDFQALFGVDLYLDAGETVAVIGANGAGKSTLMRSVAGVLSNQPEMVVYKGEPIGALSAPIGPGRSAPATMSGFPAFPIRRSASATSIPTCRRCQARMPRWWRRWS